MSIATPLRTITAAVVMAFILVPCAREVNAQIVFNKAWYEAQTDTTIELENYRADPDDSVQDVYQNEFEDGTYDFSGLSFTRVYTEVNPSLPMPADVPGADLEEFVSADYVTVFAYGDEQSPDSVSYVFNRVDDDALVQLGWYTVFDGEQAPEKTLFEPVLKPVPIPNTYVSESASEWVTESDLVIYRDGEERGRQQIRITRDVEGYGTLILPEGTYDALRVRNETRTTTGDRTTTGRSISFLTIENTTAHIILDGSGTIDRVLMATREGVETSAERPVAGLPDGYRLEQNYPNPFNPSTRIGYEIPASQHVRINVFDALGRHVKTLVDGMVPAGAHEATFDADDLPSGIYMYRMEAGPASATGRMVLLK